MRLNTIIEQEFNFKSRVYIPPVVFQQCDNTFKKDLFIFYTLFLKKHPDISPNEKIISGLIKLDLNTTEISIILNKSKNTLATARTRLRKKIKLTNTKISLQQYINSI